MRCVVERREERVRCVVERREERVRCVVERRDEGGESEVCGGEVGGGRRE